MTISLDSLHELRRDVQEGRFHQPGTPDPEDAERVIVVLIAEVERLLSVSLDVARLRALIEWLRDEIVRCDSKALTHQDGTQHQRRSQHISDESLAQNRQIRLHWAGKKVAFAEVLEKLAALSAEPPCKVCGGYGFVAQKQFLDDGYGEVDSCPACDERDAKLMAAALPPGKGPMKKQKVMWAIQHVPSGSWDQGDSNLTLYWAKHAAQLACTHGAFKPIRVVVKE